MSSPIENEQVMAVVSEIKEKKPKKPTLSAKYQKFMIFGYAFVKQLQAANLLVEETSVESALSQLQMFASVEDQTQFYGDFLEESSATGKLMRKYIQNKNKPPKAEKKPRAPRKKAVKVEGEGESEGESEGKEGESGEKPAPKARKPRAKKSVTVVNDTENNIIGQLVAAAQNDDPIVAPVVAAEKEKKPRKKTEPKAKVAVVVPPTVVALSDAVADAVADTNVEVEVKETAKPKEKKPRKKAESKAAVAPVVSTEEDKTDKNEKKPRKKAEPKAKVAEAPIVPQELVVTNELVEEKEEQEEEEDDDEIHTREFVLDGVTYLIDGDNNVYSVDESHDQVGVYNPVSKTIESL